MDDLNYHRLALIEAKIEKKKLEKKVRSLYYERGQLKRRINELKTKLANNPDSL